MSRRDSSARVSATAKNCWASCPSAAGGVWDIFGWISGLQPYNNVGGEQHRSSWGTIDAMIARSGLFASAALKGGNSTTYVWSRRTRRLVAVWIVTRTADRGDVATLRTLIDRDDVRASLGQWSLFRPFVATLGTVRASHRSRRASSRTQWAVCWCSATSSCVVDFPASSRPVSTSVTTSERTAAESSSPATDAIVAARL